VTNEANRSIIEAKETNKVPRFCSICSHPKLAEIAALLRREAYRSVAKRFGASAPAVYRHQKEHLPLKLAEQVNDSAMGTADLLELSRLECNHYGVAPQTDLLSQPTDSKTIDAAIIRKGIDGGQLVNHLGELHTSILAILHDASAAGRPETALKAVREARGNVELAARLSGLLKDGSDTSVQVAVLGCLPSEAAEVVVQIEKR
jgi:hypothetical protein